MARLNDPAPPAAESIDALKRRFVRQNRELARINSNQSVRIRNLENEISRLLSENIAFRERSIKLQHEADRSPGQATLDQIATLRNQLEVKLTDIGSLVNELGNVQQEARKVARRKSINPISPKRSPDQRNWKNALSLSEVAGIGETRLPPIVEDKYYPRRTLESEELRNILDAANTLDSPDLGPPPVASWEEQEPVKTDGEAASPIRQLQAGSFNDMQVPSLANLETRKKRRESTHQASIRPSESQVSQRAAEGKVPHQSLRAGAKRKLHVRDDDGADTQEKSLGNHNSPANHRTDASRKIMDPTGDNLTEDFTGLKIAHDQASKISEQPREKIATPLALNRPRKALGAKSVNTDPLKSPAKLNRATAGEKSKSNREVANGKPKVLHGPAERPQSRNKERPRKEQEPSKSSATSTISIPLRPETPIAPALDLLSREPSEPSVARPNSRDTPPPTDLDPGASIPDGFGTMGRARRARGSVSYAEPSLRDKMRRPTKELIDAVSADDRPQIVHVQDAKARPETVKTKPVFVKHENPEDRVDWKDLPLASDGETPQERAKSDPSSPLSNKATSTATKNLPATVTTDRRRRDSSVSHSDPPGEQIKRSTASGSAIAALVAGTQKTTSRDEQTAAKLAKGSKDIFELGSSSPADAGTVVPSAPPRTSRRHSSISSIQDRNSGKGPNTSVARRKERIRQTLANVVSNNEEDDAGSKGGQSLGVPTEGEPGRAERAVNRRRSMML